jgi:hypothetical protein
MMAEQQEVADRKYAAAYRQTEEKSALESLLRGPRVGRGVAEETGDGEEEGEEGAETEEGDLERARDNEVRETKMNYGSFAKVTEVSV